MGDELRQPWTEGPDEEVSPESWLLLDDDALLHRIETFDVSENEDERLLEVVSSTRHFFIRQEAAKRVQDRSRLFAFEDDRHVGQILVRHLTRREDVTYLERLSSRSTHAEVRSAAQVQLARLWRRLDTQPLPVASLQNAPAAATRPEPAPKPPAKPAHKPAAKPAAKAPAKAAGKPGPTAPVPPDAAPALPPAGTALEASTTPEPVTSAPLEKGGVDGSLLAWAAHFLVEPSWSSLGTKGTRELLTQTRRELLGRYPSLVFFEITPDARVATNLDGGPRLPRDTVKAVAAWMIAFRRAARDAMPVLESPSVRAATAMMADALREAGFYAACDALEGAAFR